MKKLLLLLAGLLFAVLPSVAQPELSKETTTVETVPLEAGHYYTIKSDNQSGNRFYLTGQTNANKNFTGNASTALTPSYYWKCNIVEDGTNTYYTFQNAETGKYLGYKVISDTPVNIIIKGKKVFNKECLPLFFSEANKYFLVTNSDAATTTTYNHANDPYRVGYSSDFYFTEVIYDESYPFLLSEAPSETGFSSNTYWHYLKLNNKYATYSDDLEYISLSSTNPANYGSYWAFVKKEDGSIEIYNAATGPTKVLASDAPNPASDDEGKTTRPTMQTKKALPNGTIGAWDFTNVDDSNGGFYLDRAGEESYKLNDFAGDNIMTFWTANQGDGSVFRVEPVSVNTLIQSLKEYQTAIHGAVGTLNSEDYTQFIEALDLGTGEGYVKALRIQAERPKIQFSTDMHYYLYAYKSASSNKYMKIKYDASLVSQNIQSDSVSIIWKFSGDESNGYKISGQGKYLNKVTIDSRGVPTVSDEGAAASYKLMKVPNKAAAFYIRPTDGKGLHIDASGNVVGWNEGGGSEWYLIEAPSIDITISSAGYTTVNYPFAVELPEDQDITAYFATIIDGNNNNLMLRKVYSGHIPANTPVVLQGTPNTYTLNIVSEDKPTNISNNILEGTLLSETMGAGDIFVLSKPENKNVGFYLLNDAENANRTIPANKAYLPGSNLPVTSQGVRGFTFSFEDSDGETTDIENEIVDLSQEEFYDLQGRRVQNPTKGIYVTKSGKKILFVK